MTNMEADGVENCNSNSCSNRSEGGKYANSKAFVEAARQYESTHSEASLSLMKRHLNLLASTCDLSIFAPGRSEVCALFSSLLDVMTDPGGPHWAGVAVLSRACMEPSARHALTHTYKFMPILTRLLSNSISHAKKIKLLSVMQDISYGIIIFWPEPYLPVLMKQLTDWITVPCNDTQTQKQLIRHRSLTVLANICSGNLPAVYALMRTIDTKKFVGHLMSLKEGRYGADVCRLLLSLSAATRGAGAVHQTDVDSYLSCSVLTFSKAVIDKDASQLLQAYTLMKELCQHNNLRNLVANAPDFCLEDTLMNLVEFCNAPNEGLEPEQVTAVVQNALKFLSVLVNLDMYPLRKIHYQMLSLCLVAHRLCLPESLELFSSIIIQYKDEGQLPEDLILMISEDLPELLVAPALERLEPGKAGLQWLQVVGALCDNGSTQEQVLRAVSPEAYEEILYSVLENSSQNASVGHEAAVLGCKTALTLAPLLQAWGAALKRFLLNNQVRNMLSTGLRNGTRRVEILKLIRHHLFPCEMMDEVFKEAAKLASEGCTSPRAGCSGEAGQSPAPGQEHPLDALIRQHTKALQKNKISDIATSSVVELYGYKIACLKQILHVELQSLEGASERMASMQHYLAMLEATNSSLPDDFTQMQNEILIKTKHNQHKQLEETEATVRGYQAKLEILQNEFETQLTTLENEMSIDKENEENLKAAEKETKAVLKLLDQKKSECNELVAVLIQFKEQVQTHVKEIEEANALQRSLRKEIERKDMAIKQQVQKILEFELMITLVDEITLIQEMIIMML